MSNKPVVVVENGRGLSVSVFKNATEEGKVYYNTPRIENRYYDKKAEEWKSTSRLSESDFLEAAELLRDAARELRQRRVSKIDKVDATNANDAAAEPKPEAA